MWASAFKSSRMVVGLKWTPDQKVACVFVAFEWNCQFLNRFKVFENDRFNYKLQMAEKENTDRIGITLTFHPHNPAVKSIILKNFKL